VLDLHAERLEGLRHLGRRYGDLAGAQVEPGAVDLEDEPAALRDRGKRLLEAGGDAPEKRAGLLVRGQLEEEAGVSIRLINLPWLNRIDPGWLRDSVGSCRSVVTLDNHYLHGGQGEMIGAALSELGLEPSRRLTRVGVTELPECGTNDEVLAYHRLDIPSLVQTFRGALSTSAVTRKVTQLT